MNPNTDQKLALKGSARMTWARSRGQSTISISTMGFNCLRYNVIDISNPIPRKGDRSSTPSPPTQAHIAANLSLPTLPRFVRFLATQRSWLSCMASQLSGERPMALERRSAMSGVTRLVPLSTRLSVEAATSSLAASSRPLMP